MTVDWLIQGVNGVDPTPAFQQYQGSLQFLPVSGKHLGTKNVLIAIGLNKQNFLV